MTTKTARLIGPVNPEANGDQKLYRLTPPMPGWEPWSDDEKQAHWDYVVVSAVNAMFSGPETYIFGADSAGEILDWSELDGSFKGALDHEQALRNAGYEAFSGEVIDAEYAVVAPLEIEAGES